MLKKNWVILFCILIFIFIGGIMFVKVISYYENMGYTYSESKGIIGMFSFAIGIIVYIVYSVFKKISS